MRSIHIAFATLAALSAMACGGGGGTTPPPDRVFTSVSVSPQTVSVPVQGTSQLTATPRDQNGTAMTGLPAATFSSSDNTKATVSTTGLVTGVAAGSADVTASVTHAGSTRSATVAVTVTAGAAPLTATVQAGNTTVFTPSSVTIAQNGVVTWEWAGLEHNVTFATASGAPADIPTRSTGSVSRTFATLGTFAYSCTLHAGMTGDVRVVQP